MTRMVSQILWEHCMGELGYGGNDYENDTFAVRSYNWADEDTNDWHFWHKPSGLKIGWYKYPLRGFKANMEITDDQFLDVLRDCTNSMEYGKSVRFLHDIRRWWVDHDSSEKSNNCETCRFELYCPEMCEGCCEWDSHYEPKDELRICDFCRYYNSNIPCGSTPSACKKADKFAKEFIDELKKLKSKDEPKTCEDCKHNGEKYAYDYACDKCTDMDKFQHEDEPKTKLVNNSQILVKDLVNDEFNPYDEECMRCKHLKLKCEFIPTYCKFESRDELQSEKYVGNKAILTINNGIVKVERVSND